MDVPEKQRSAVWQAIGFAWDFGVVVVTPLIVLGAGGRLLDKQFGTHPWMFLISVVSAIIISTMLLVLRLKRILGKISSPKVK